MNLKLNNELQSSQRTLSAKPRVSSIKEERRRTGRYIAILVGISLFLLAMYHAWVRRIPVVASLVVPALIMFVYVAWVLYTASRDKHKLLDAEAALQAISPDTVENDPQLSEGLQNNIDIAPVSSKESSKLNTPEEPIHKDWPELNRNKDEKAKTDNISNFITPIILINDKLPEDLDQRWMCVIQALVNKEKLKVISSNKKYKRRFCRRKHAVFKRSYSIA